MTPGEILSPAGSMEALIAAVRAGADGVYLGAGSFSARRNAPNFSDGELREAVSFCHVRRVRVYLALNTLISDEELPAALSLAELACSAGVDALIVQDLGVAALLRECCPEMPLHASTQMSIHTPSVLPLLKKWGFSRVVPARELSREELTELCAAAKKAGLETEMFVHGALCMSVSGQCWLSAALGGRSGNRGLCAGPCRLPFSVPGGTGHDLSLKDLCLADRLGELSAMGVDSFKIEGRMKGPEYAAATAFVYHKASRGEAVTSEDLAMLSGVFSRGGFTAGYYDGKLGRAMFGVKEPDGNTPALLRSIHELYRRERQSVPLSLFFVARAGEPCRLKAVCGAYAVQAQGPVPAPAIHREITEESVRAALSKLGGTPYFAETVEIQTDPGLSLSQSALNALRREVLERLTEQRAKPRAKAFVPPALLAPEERKRRQKPELRGVFRSPEQVPQRHGLDWVYLPPDAPPEAFSRLAEEGNVGVALPRGMFGREGVLAVQLKSAAKSGAKAVLAGNLGALPLAQKAGLACHGGFSLNVFNRESARLLACAGISDATLSMELTAVQIRALATGCPAGMISYGRQPLMLLRVCPLQNGDGCQSCPGVITDRKGIAFPVLCGGGCSELFNSSVLWLADRLGEFPVDFHTLLFTTECKAEAAGVICAYRAGLSGEKPPPPKGHTRGLYFRGVQ